MTTEKINRRLRSTEGQMLSVDALQWSGDLCSYFALKVRLLLLICVIITINDLSIPVALW